MLQRNDIDLAEDDRPWEGLMTALEHGSVKSNDLAEGIRQRFGITRQPESAAVKEPETTRTSKPSASSEFSAALLPMILLNLWPYTPH